MASAIRAIARTSTLRIEKDSVTRVNSMLITISRGNDKNGLLRLVSDLESRQVARQTRQLVAVAADVCKIRGFTPDLVSTESGIVSSRKVGTGESLNIEIARKKDGGLCIHLVGDGFRGNACVAELDAVQEELCKRGIRIHVDSRRGKHQRGAFQQTGTANRIHTRQA